jgi:GH15 family glucan-1,4-alpha-glucosidase
VSCVPIADHALVSDCHSAGLVTRDGSIDWLSFPRFDSPAVFARLLGDGAGHWSMRPRGPYEVTRRYLERTLVLETTFRTASGELAIVDALALGPHDEGHALGRGAPHLLLRIASCTRGSVTFDVELAPRPEYGLVVPLLSRVPGGIVARGGPDSLLLSTPLDLAFEDDLALAAAELREGETLAFGLQRSSLEQGLGRALSQRELLEVLDDTIRAWRSWSALHQAYEGPFGELVHHSGRVLQALTFQPTGAIVAAPTTSLPESVGGERNWDYRYAWVRDASFTMEALWVAACPDEASDFFRFVTTAAAASIGPRHELQIVFGVGAEHDLTERELTHLAGWRGSRPVRVGNRAFSQRQIDVYGEPLSAAWRLAERIGSFDEPVRAFLVGLADAAAIRWRDPDQGIWEVRGPARHFVHSKVMCWVALDRAIALSDRLAAADRVEAWRSARDEIHDAVVRFGWSDEVGAFTQSFGSTLLDASALALPIVGFLAPDDPRSLATIDAVERELSDPRGLVYRYHAEAGVDGVRGDEGTFLLCTFWLAQALAMAGRIERSRAVLARAAAFANDVGLFSEEIDPDTGELLGNFPQAFSHIGLVNAAWALAEAERRAAEPAASDEPRFTPACPHGAPPR